MVLGIHIFITVQECCVLYLSDNSFDFHEAAHIWIAKFRDWSDVIRLRRRCCEGGDPLISISPKFGEVRLDASKISAQSILRPWNKIYSHPFVLWSLCSDAWMLLEKRPCFGVAALSFLTLHPWLLGFVLHLKSSYGGIRKARWMELSRDSYWLWSDRQWRLHIRMLEWRAGENTGP